MTEPPTEEEAKIGRVMAAAKRAGNAVAVGWNRQTGGEVSDELLAMIAQATSNAIFRCLAAGSLREDEIIALTEALRLTKADKEDALARAAAENQKLRDELVGARESWYTRYLAAEDRATKAEEGLRVERERIRKLVLEPSDAMHKRLAHILNEVWTEHYDPMWRAFGKVPERLVEDELLEKQVRAVLRAFAEEIGR